MRRIGGIAAGITAVTATVLVTTAFTAAQKAGPHGKEVIKIVSKVPGPYHAQVTARGAFRAKGYFLRRRASLVFPDGRLAVRRHLISTTNWAPNLATCWFKARQTGTFRVFYSTGKYRGLRWDGNFTTSIAGRLNRTGPNQCGSKIVAYSAVTYEIGTIP
ncbi:MAG TPA: hypothetical protein VFI65_17970 [Streptosporangiaceae bacterium]|nr:hypothetical protein [Streptosporangiaceae bacterium]